MKKRKPLTKAQKEAQERNWLKFRIKGMRSVLSGKNIQILVSILGVENHPLIWTLIGNLDNLIKALEEK